MDKITDIFSLQLKKMSQDYHEKIIDMPAWQLDNFLPIDFKQKDIHEKINYLISNFKTNNPLYQLINEDLNLILEKSCSISNLRSLNLDPRYLEGLGLKEKQINEYYEFVNRAKASFE